MKKCYKCKEEKELTEFSKNKLKKDGYDGKCKSCFKEYRENNKEKIKEYRKEYKKYNKEKIKEHNKKYYEKIKEYHKEYFKEYRKNNKEKIKEYKKEYLENNKEKIKYYFKEYRENNKELIKEKRKEYFKEYRKKNIEKKKEYNKQYSKNNREKINEHRKQRIKTDPLFKLRCNISSLIYNSIKKQGYTKRSQTYKILGCTYEEFKIHLENQFTDGMTWENQGEWHLDHIYPVSLAKDEEELIKLNHYTNFQPLWAEDNLKKSNKII